MLYIYVIIGVFLASMGVFVWLASRAPLYTDSWPGGEPR
jgi:hypothetical protein